MKGENNILPMSSSPDSGHRRQLTVPCVELLCLPVLGALSCRFWAVLQLSCLVGTSGLLLCVGIACVPV